jgi:hypothetical protein
LAYKAKSQTHELVLRFLSPHASSAALSTCDYFCTLQQMLC